MSGKVPWWFRSMIGCFIGWWGGIGLDQGFSVHGRAAFAIILACMCAAAFSLAS